MPSDLILANLAELERELLDDSISEIMINGNGHHFFEKAGRLHPLNVTIHPRRLMTTIEIIAHELGKECDERNPILDGRLADGSRIAALVPPCSPDGPMLTIRKFPKRRLTLLDLLQSGSLPVMVLDHVAAALKQNENILTSGGTGSGKTTMLNAFTSLLPQTSRIVVIEDTKEIQIEAKHCARMEARQKSDTFAAVTIRQLLKAALRHRPDHIVLGEVRGAEAYDLLQAMNTGHGGSLTTIHANSPQLALNRLESCVLQAGIRLPIAAIRRQIADAIRLVVQVKRTADGSRKVATVIKTTGLSHRDAYQTEVLYEDGPAASL